MHKKVAKLYRDFHKFLTLLGLMTQHYGHRHRSKMLTKHPFPYCVTFLKFVVLSPECEKKNQGHVFLEITTRIDSDLNKKLPRPKETLAQFRDSVYGFLQTKSTTAQ